nr:MAG TPA: hypothetical protein [Bacteriophage sp.]
MMIEYITVYFSLFVKTVLNLKVSISLIVPLCYSHPEVSNNYSCSTSYKSNLYLLSNSLLLAPML